MRVDLRRSPDKTAALAGVGMVRDFGECLLVNVTRAALRTVQDHRDGPVVGHLAGFE